MTAPVLRIGTRGSPLALAQAHETRDRLCKAHGLDPDSIAIEIFKTTGDAILDRPLSEVGGKGLFTKELEVALLEGAIDLAVHSSKDMPTVLPEGLIISAYLPREDVRDALIAPAARSLNAIPPGSVIGTASLRRQAMVRRVRPDLEVQIIRGNVQTRLRKIADGEASATLLALAGLRRLGLEQHATAIFSVEEFLPAVGQGAICIETREKDERTRALLDAIDDPETAIALTMERAFLTVLDGSCRTPIAGHATLSGGAIRFRGMILRPDGSEAHETARYGAIGDAFRMGRDAGEELRGRGGPDFFAGS
jgi:hydroxymethylbilane synthase